MSNYLTRTAARAAPDTAPAVRPRLQSRFEGPATPAPAVVAWETPAPLPAAVAQGETSAPVLPREREVHHHHEVFRGRNEADGSIKPHGHGTHEAHTSHTDSPDPSLPAEPPLLATTPVPLALGPSPAASDPALAPSTIAHRLSSNFPPPPASPVASAIAHRALAITQQPTVFSPAAQAAPAPSPIGHRPSSILPATAPLLESPHSALPASTIAAPAAPEQRTVNITIGRLEIRAATPAAERPRTPRQAGRSPLALDEFLSGKSRARPPAS